MVDENRWGMLYCPKGGYRTHKRWERIEACLKQNGIQYDFVQSENVGSVERLVRMLINNGYKTIIVVGGDSALNDAVNCLMQIDREAREQISLGVIPNGVMNDFAHFWELKENDIEGNIQSLKKHRVRKVDLGCIRYVNKEGEKCHRYFLNCINIGFIAAIMNLRRRAHHLFGSRTLSFLASFLLLIFQRLDYKMHLKINTDIIKKRVMTVCIGNASGYGQTPNAVPYNGLLDVSVVYHPKTRQLIDGIYLLVKGKFLNHSSVHSYRTREIDVNQAEHALVGIDGRLLNTPVGPFKITVEQELINFLM
jgi:diacylglycerol kinase family enzyme